MRLIRFLPPVVLVLISLIVHVVYSQAADSVIIIKDNTPEFRIDDKKPRGSRYAAAPVKPDFDPKTAAIDFSSGNFRKALEEYQGLYESDSANTEYAYKLAVCYLNTFTDREKTIPLLLKASADNTFTETMVWYELGRAYQANYKFDEAIKVFRKFKTIATGKEIIKFTADLQIKMCENAKTLVSRPLNVRFENLGSEINSEGPDFNAFVPLDESFIVFTSKRDNNTGKTMDYDGYNTSDVYWNTLKSGRYGKTKNLGPVINSALVEDVVGLSADGEVMLLSFENYTAIGDLFFSNKKGRSFQRPEPYFFPVNTTDIESSAALSPTKDTIYFSSARQGGKGAGDIFMSVRLPIGDWGTPTPVEILNTPEDENFPYVSPDGQYLYFASYGHNSMGGYDIFRSAWIDQEKKWGKPENVGFPVNTVDDNLLLCFGRSRHYAYTSAVRPEGYGNLDIYKVFFLNEEPLSSLVEVMLCAPDSNEIVKAMEYEISQIREILLNKTKEGKAERDSIINIAKKDTLIDFELTLIDTVSGKVAGMYHVSGPTGRCFIYLPTGVYRLSIVGEGYDCSQLFIIPDKERYQSRYAKKVILESQIVEEFQEPEDFDNNEY
ncbi:MAG: hypothetical protein KKD31_12885 [Bacteroidetes bacterium]|nr:hypothetical protein [Bacteroidota bacterium]